jgi:3'-phosphoadenosine 5'-phosphosulfate sulfotransferase (PAPS reductase)/FAD synthetase
MHYIVSFSGGKDSTAMLIKLLEEKKQVDEILFFDTGWEFPAIYSTVKKVEEYIKRPIVWLKPEKSFEYYMYEKPNKRGIGLGFPRFNIRWCTGLKKTTIHKYLKDKKPFVNYLGLTKGEEYRAKRYADDKTVLLPLIEWGMTEQDCLNYCKDKGFDFENLYKCMSSASCWCCPLQPMTSLRGLYKNFPDLWKELLKMQSKTKSPFKVGHVDNKKGKDRFPPIYVTDLDIRFKKEIKEGIFDKKLGGY